MQSLLVTSHPLSKGFCHETNNLTKACCLLSAFQYLYKD